MKNPHSAMSVLREDLLFVCAMAALSVPVGLGVNSLRSKPLPLRPRPPEERLLDGIVVRSSAADTKPAEIDLDEAIRLHDEKLAVFVDAREAAFYELGRVPGAVSLPRATFPEVRDSFVQATEKRRRLIVYCSEPDCVDSTIVAKALMRLGFENVAVFKGGWVEWEAAGLPQEP